MVHLNFKSLLVLTRRLYERSLYFNDSFSTLFVLSIRSWHLSVLFKKSVFPICPCEALDPYLLVLIYLYLALELPLALKIEEVGEHHYLNEVSQMNPNFPDVKYLI